MKVPLSWIRDFVPLPESLRPSEIVEKLVGLGFEVDGKTIYLITSEVIRKK